MKFALMILTVLWLVTVARADAGKLLTLEQVKKLALKLANDEAVKEYHTRPFHEGKARQRKDGEWVWKNTSGVGRGDMMAEVDLAPTGEVKGVHVMVITDLPLLRAF